MTSISAQSKVHRSTHKSTSSAPQFLDTSKGTAKTLAGKNGTSFELTKGMSSLIENLPSAYGGVVGSAAQLKPADLASVLKSKQGIGDLMAGVAGYLDDQGTVTNRKIEPLKRGALLGAIAALNKPGDGFSADDKKKMEAGLRPVVASMLADPGAKVFHMSGYAQDDWGIDIFMAADPKSGRVKVFTQDGDM